MSEKKRKGLVARAVDKGCEVTFTLDGEKTTMTLRSPTAAQIERFRAEHKEWLKTMQKIQDKDEAEQYDATIAWENASVEWLRMCLPEDENPSELTADELKEFIRRTGGVNSRLMIMAQSLCGVLMVQRATNPF